MKKDIEHFPRKFFAGERQSNAILQAYADVLHSTWDIWDPVVAASIITSSLQFINCNVLEERIEFQSMVLTKASSQLPEYLRDREGVPDAYSYMTFPAANYPDISKFLDAIPDMGKTLNLVNDVLS